MKRIVSGILIFSIIVSTANITFAEKSINDELLNSKSWKLTKPLRKLKNIK